MTTEPLLAPRDAAARLCIGARKLWELTNRGEIPHLRIGRAVRYDPADIEQWIQDQKRRARSADARWSREVG